MQNLGSDVSEVMTNKVRTAIKATGDKRANLHVWRLGPGHFATIIAVPTNEQARGPAFYHAVLKRVTGLWHRSVEVHAKPKGG